jgi:hypothetical protein
MSFSATSNSAIHNIFDGDEINPTFFDPVGRGEFITGSLSIFFNHGVLSWRHLLRAADSLTELSKHI